MDSDSVTLLLDLPSSGSDKIFSFIIEMKDLKRNVMTEEVLEYTTPSDLLNEGDSNSSNTTQLTFKFEKLIPHYVYCFRSKAESLVGVGVVSEWSVDAVIPTGNEK
jgi:hypothetical protein